MTKCSRAKSSTAVKIALKIRIQGTMVALTGKVPLTGILTRSFGLLLIFSKYEKLIDLRTIQKFSKVFLYSSYVHQKQGM